VVGVWQHAAKHKIEGWLEVTERRGRRYKQLLDEVKEKRRY